MNETAANPDNSAAPELKAPAPVPAPPPVARSIGERLRAGRERSGLSIPAAAEKLHLDPKVIEALEADRFAEIGASVYVRGHLKRYADFVGESGVELVNMYGTRETRTAAPDLTQVPHPERRADPRRLVTPMVALGSAAVLFGAIWWVLAGSRANDAAPPAQATPVVAGDAAPVSHLPVAATPATLTTGAAVVTPGEARQPDTTPAVAPAPPPKEAPATEIQLRLELADESWVEVYDSRGTRLYFDVASAGSVQSVSGRGPLRVFLGNSAGVSVEVDGQRREIPAGAADGDGARFVVNRNGTLARAR